MLKEDPVDWELDDNFRLIIPIRYTFGEKAVKQGAKIRLAMAAGEWFLNLAAGLPLLPNANAGIGERDAILGQPYDEAKAIAAIRRELLTTPGLATIDEIKTSYDGDTRTLRIRWKGTCAWGDTVADVFEATDPTALAA